MSTEKSWDKPLKGESSKLFNRFTIFRDLPPEKRTVKNAWEIIKVQENSGNESHDKEIKLSTIEKNCAEKFWIERAALSDYNKQLQEAEKNERNFTKQSQKAKRFFKKIMNWADKTFKKITESEYALSTQIRLMADITHIASKAHEQFRLASGRSTTNNFNDNRISGTLNVNGIPGQENIHEITDDDLELILSANDDYEDFTDKI